MTPTPSRIIAILGKGPATLSMQSNALDRMPFAELVGHLEAMQKAGLVVKLKTDTGTVWTVR